MRKVLYLSLKEFRSAQKRQLEDGTPNSNGNLVHTFPGTVELVLVPMTFVRLAFYFRQQFLLPAQFFFSSLFLSVLHIKYRSKQKRLFSPGSLVVD